MRRRRQVFCCPPPHSLRECLLLPNSCSQPSYCARMGGAMVVPQRPSDRVRLTIVATALLRVFHLLPIARRSPAATEHDVGGGRRRVAPTGGGSITRQWSFPRRATVTTSEAGHAPQAASVLLPTTALAPRVLAPPSPKASARMGGATTVEGHDRIVDSAMLS